MTDRTRLHVMAARKASIDLIDVTTGDNITTRCLALSVTGIPEGGGTHPITHIAAIHPTHLPDLLTQLSDIVTEHFPDTWQVLLQHPTGPLPTWPALMAKKLTAIDALINTSNGIGDHNLITSIRRVLHPHNP